MTLTGVLVFAASWLFAVNLLGLGNTVGYHRLLTHRAFQCGAGTRAFWTLAGAMHGGSPMMWVGLHRLHHTKSDAPEDPHTPTKGFWAAHSGWLVGTTNPLLSILFALTGFGQQLVILVHDVQRILGLRQADWVSLCPDLKKERLMRWLDIPLVMPALFGLQLLLAWVVGGPWGILWLYLLHLFLTNSSWSVNSVCHWPKFGVQRWDTGDWSRDVWWMGVITNGESFHNAHHRYPRSARHALEGGQDLSWRVIQLMCALGLASDPWLPKKYRDAA
ncbi:MAG: acyl-CoA desaturase [Alphaproteobacteria bacterium]|nr:acyl-CoA desaturase [Alphaproteobacteria bacterium]